MNDPQSLTATSPSKVPPTHCKHRHLVRVGANSYQCAACGVLYTASLSPFNQGEDSAVDYAVIHATPPLVEPSR